MHPGGGLRHGVDELHHAEGVELGLVLDAGAGRDGDLEVGERVVGGAGRGRLGDRVGRLVGRALEHVDQEVLGEDELHLVAAHAVHADSCDPVDDLVHHAGVDGGGGLSQRSGGTNLTPAVVGVDQHGAEDEEAEKLPDVHGTRTGGGRVLGHVDQRLDLTVRAGDAPRGQQGRDLHGLLVGEQLDPVVGVEVEGAALQREALEAAGDGAQAVFQLGVGHAVTGQDELRQVSQLVLAGERELHEGEVAEGFRLCHGVGFLGRTSHRV